MPYITLLCIRIDVCHKALCYISYIVKNNNKKAIVRYRKQSKNLHYFVHCTLEGFLPNQIRY